MMLTKQGYALLDFFALLAVSLCSLFLDSALPILVFIAFLLMTIQHALTLK